MNEENQPQTFTGQNQNPVLAPQDFPTPTGQDIGPATQDQTVPSEPLAPEAPQRPHVTETPQKALRTYESDVADVLAHKKISTATIALAEQKKNTGQNNLGESTESLENKADRSQVIKKTLIALAGIILIGGGIGGAYYFYSISPLAGSKNVTPQAPTPISIVKADTRVALAIDSLNPNSVIAAVRKEIAKPQQNDTIKEIVFTEIDSGGQKIRVPAPDAYTTMDLTAPDILYRALSNDWMLGVYADKQGSKDVFIVATISYFQNAFAGMLQWESFMADDLKQYFYQNTPADISARAQVAQTASSSENTSTSTPVVDYQNDPRYKVIRGLFTDRIIRNKDVREFVVGGNTLFLYSFLDNTKLVITGSESTLNAILDRLEQKAFIR
ncbi:MAG: hypothetical protein PHG25_03045 [Candidatus Pacebacteria bacterium]|nr:hypothetical protein [Candidatus Paceibacterota bacterium]